MNPSSELARDVVDALITAGVRHVVLAPGSRSAPLAYALQDADRAGVLTLHVRVDERAAGFLALGLAKVSRIPAAVVTTSGTAVANLHPAVLEAHHGLVPLVVISADRPAELRGIGANQTTIQPGLFGEAVRFASEVRSEDDPGERRRVLATALAPQQRWQAGAVAAPGPVHLNVAFREPLVPDLTGPAVAEWPDRGSAVETDSHDLGAPDEASIAGASPGLWPERTLVIIGDLPEPDQARTVARWAQAHGWPVVAEPFGEQPLGSTVLPHGPLLLATAWFRDHRPERIVVAGRVTLSRSVRAALTVDPARVTYVSAGPRWIGPSYEVADEIAIEALDSAAPTPATAVPSDWLRSWWRAAAATGAALDADLGWGSGPSLARCVADALPDGATLVLGSSNSVRDVELAVDWGAAERTAVRVVANRGLAGIDGVLSTAVGVALAAGSPTYALVGDLTFLHDSNALLIGVDEPAPDLTIIVANDDGGGIFGTLEPGEPERSADFERIFGTATGARIADLARAYRIGYGLAESAADLAALVRRPPQGLTIVEVPLDRSGHRALRRRLADLADRATETA